MVPARSAAATAPLARQQPEPPPPPPPRSLSELLDGVAARAPRLGLLLIAAGVLGLLAVPLLEREINFDENALLAGSARPTMRLKSPGAYDAGRAFAAQLRPALFSPVFAGALQAALAARGWEVSNHTFAPPAGAYFERGGGAGGGGDDGDGDEVGRRGAAAAAAAAADDWRRPASRCTNVHAALPSPRGDGKEALLLVTPINHQRAAPDYDQEGSGAALALSVGAALLTHLAAAAPWLAKDVVWLLPDASCGLVASVQAWADAYQHPPLLDHHGALTHFTRHGVLQQAIVLEAPTGEVNALQASIEAHNGLLPKLDTFWLLRWYAHHYARPPFSLPHMGELERRLRPPVEALLNAVLPDGGARSRAGRAALGHLSRLATMLQFMRVQAKGLPTGAHAPLKALMVDAATLRVVSRGADGRVRAPAGYAPLRQSPPWLGPDQGQQPQPPPSPPPLPLDAALAQLGDVLELALRSCSGLIERFHHSLFLYVLTSLDAYVSVERYIGPLVALALVLPLRAAALRAHDSAVADKATGAAGSSDGGRRQRAEWAAALRGVALAHLAGAAAGLALRRAAPRPAAAATAADGDAARRWLATALADPSAHARELAAAAAAALALALAAQALAAAAVGAAGRRGPAGAASLVSRPPSARRKRLAVELTVAAGALAALACLNWALAYAACLALVPLAQWGGPPPPPPSSSSLSQEGRAGRHLRRVARALLLGALSPPGVLAALWALDGGGGGSRGSGRAAWSWLQAGVLGGSAPWSYALFWALLVPFWWLHALS